MASRTKDPGIGRTILDDLHRSDFWRTVKLDYRALKAFYISDEQQERLKKMNRLRRFFFISFWLLKSMFFKLTPARRLLLVLGLFLVATSHSLVYESANIRASGNSAVLGGALLLFILMLELKDKLLARDELQAGRQVQYALMPEESPDIPGWDVWMFTRPANDVGGDLIDYLPLGEGRAALALGDVAGKGLPAALLMAKLQATLRAVAPGSSSLVDLGLKLNEIFYRDTQKKNFATLVYLKLAEGSGQIEYLNAGHMPPLRLSAGIVREQSRGGPALGLTPSAEFKVQSVHLAKDEYLIIYSDGICDARDENGQLFGEERLMELLRHPRGLSAKELGRRILTAISMFIGEALPHDDSSLIIIRKL